MKPLDLFLTRCWCDVCVDKTRFFSISRMDRVTIEMAAKPETTVWDSVPTSVGMKPLDLVSKLAVAHFPATLVATNVRFFKTIPQNKATSQNGC